MKFDVDAFSFLQDNEYPEGYTTISKEELTNTITALMEVGITEEDAPEVFKTVETYLLFLGRISSACIGGAPSDDALTVKCDSEGIIEQVYGPAIFQNEDGETPVMRVCNDFYSLKFNGTDITCGAATGDVSVEEKAGKDEDGKDIKVLSIAFEGYFDEIDSGFEIGFILNQELTPGKPKVKKWLKDGSLGEFNQILKPAPSGGQWTKLDDLELGEYRVYNIEEQKPHPEYGRSWLIFLEGVGPCISKGKRLEATLARNARIYEKTLAANRPLTFNVSSKEQLSQGIRVTCGFFSREPRPEKMIAGAQPKQAIGGATEPTNQLAGAQQTLQTTAVTMADIPL